MSSPAIDCRVALLLIVWPLVGCLTQHLGDPASAHGAEQPSKEPAKARLPVPDAGSVDEARELIKKAYADDYKTATDDPEPLIQKLLLAVIETDDPARKYAMLLEAEQAAVDGRVPSRAMEVVDFRADAFDIEKMRCRVERLATFLSPKTYRDTTLMASLSDIALSKASESMDANMLVHAKAAATISATAAKKLFLVGKATQDESLVGVGQEKSSQAGDLLKIINRRMDAAAAYGAALESLKATPDDSVAKSVAGRYMCLTLNDWSGGLPLLAKGSQKDLAEVAMIELKTLAEPSPENRAVFILAGKWWDIAESRTYSKEEVVALKRHAGRLYAGVLKQLADPLESALAENRIAAVGEGLDGASAESLPKQIANPVGMKMILVQPGEFRMGAKRGVAPVTISSPFYIAQAEVTQAQWRRVMETTPWSGRPHVQEVADAPASFVTWHDAVSFCERLTALERKKSDASRNLVYQLPTEAQWEYSCRAGTQSVFSFGDDPAKLSDYGWWGGHLGPPGNARQEQYAHPVGRKKANQWQLFDMHGNQWEWCADIDSQGSAVMRGGSWNGEAHTCESGSRVTYPSQFKEFSVGFRVIGVPQAKVGMDSDSRTAVVESNRPWQSAGLVKKGSRLTLSAKGTWVGFSPDGDGLHRFSHDPVPDAPSCALLGRIGQKVFVVGSGTSLTVTQDGALEFRINDADQFLFDNSGTLEVRIKESR